MHYPPSTRSGLSLVLLVLVQVLGIPRMTSAEEKVPQATVPALDWTTLPDLPDPIGFGGPYAGVHENALIVAGGANFPEKPPWENGEKIWYDRIFVLPTPSATEWIPTETRLESRMGYGGSVSTPDGVIFLGGSNGTQVFDTVIRYRWNSETQKLSSEILTPLPKPSTYLSAALLGQKLYVVPGHATLEPDTAPSELWALDLSLPKAEQQWEILPGCPTGARIKTVVAVQKAGGDQEYLYLFSGEINTREDAQVKKEYSADAWRFDPHGDDGKGTWERRASLPRPVAAGTALPFGQSHILVFSGSTGEHVHKPTQDQPEFPRDVLAYHTITDTWVKAGEMPEGVVTTTAVTWGDRLIVVSGEIRPGVRTNKVQMAVPTKRTEGRMGAVNMTVLIVYLAALVVIGIYFSQREKGTSDYFLAGRRIPWWAAGLSIYATQLSAITFIALPGLIYAGNWLIFPGQAMIFFMAPIIVFFYLPFFRRLNLTTAYEYLEHRFGLSVRLFGSLSFIVYQFARMAIVVFIPALALAAVTGMNIYLCIVLMGLLSTIYTVLGGMEAVIWTDVLQVFVLWGGMFLGIGIIISEVGGMNVIWETAQTDEKLRMFNWVWDPSQMATWVIVLGFFALQFPPYTTDQAVIQRYMTTKDEAAAAKGIWLNGVLSVLFSIVFFGLGTCLYVFFKQHPELLGVGMKHDEVFPLFVAERLPIGVSGLVIAGVFAASMSSLDSSMHSVATAVTTDFYRRFQPDATDHQALKLARIITVLVGVIGTGSAMLVAAWDIRSLFELFQKMLGLIGSGLSGIFILGIFTRRANAAGTLVGAACGIGTLVYLWLGTTLNFYLHAVIGISVTVLAGYFASFMLPSRKPAPAGLTWHTRKQAVQLG